MKLSTILFIYNRNLLRVQIVNERCTKFCALSESNGLEPCAKPDFFNLLLFLVCLPLVVVVPGRVELPTSTLSV